METPVSEAYVGAGNYHDASSHGLAWATLNELLHVIVFVYTLYGMINFRVKFIRMMPLINWITRLLIAHNWYLTIKFGLLAAVMYVYNVKLEMSHISLSTFNCSLENFPQVVPGHLSGILANMSKPEVAQQLPPLDSIGRLFAKLSAALERPDRVLHFKYMPLFNWLLHHFGGPFKLLGNRATLMYSFYSISIYAMLAIFPLELTLDFVQVGFNFIRFVLSDPGCMSELYEKRLRHLDRLSSWSRNCTNSLQTHAVKMGLSQRDLRANYTDDSRHLLESRWPRLRKQSISQQRASLAGAPTNQERANIRQVAHKLSVHIRQLSTRSSINHSDEPNYQVRVATKNLQKFKPFVRSEVWFKMSMIIYVIFIFFYFTQLLIVIGAIAYYAQKSASKIIENCANENSTTTTTTTTTTSNIWTSTWTSWDYLIYYESLYTIFLLACASSFYCSYYFGTILELSVWLEEIKQQLELCIQLIGLHNQLVHSPGGLSSALHYDYNEQVAKSLTRLDKQMNDFGGMVQFEFVSSRGALRLRTLLVDFLLLRVWKLPQALAWLCSTIRAKKRGSCRSFDGVVKRELMAFKLLTKKSTLLRATYVNMCLFFDEHNETRFMTSTILKRTIQIASGFAIMASITRSQFKANYWQLFFLLLVTFTVFNLYLVGAAYINSRVDKMLVLMHSLIAASMKTNCEDVHLFEFWLRHVNSFGEDRDVMAYSFYGYKVTWSSILNLDSFLSSLYFLTNDQRE